MEQHRRNEGAQLERTATEESHQRKQATSHVNRHAINRTRTEKHAYMLLTTQNHLHKHTPTHTPAQTHTHRYFRSETAIRFPRTSVQISPRDLSLSRVGSQLLENRRDCS